MFMLIRSGYVCSRIVGANQLLFWKLQSGDSKRLVSLRKLLSPISMTLGTDSTRPLLPDELRGQLNSVESV